MLRLRWLLSLGLVIGLTSLAPAVIKKLTPLKEVIEAEELIFTATVESVDPSKPAAIFSFTENLKGKAAFERMPVNLTGDAEAQREKQTAMILERLGKGRKMVVFASKQGKDYSAFVYLEGTWFQMKGLVDAETKAVRWAFLHGEPYFRRTFKGSTAELIQTVQDALSGKKAPPPPDEKAPPGYGPKADADPPPAAQPNQPLARYVASGPFFAVIPSFVLLGPLAILAAFFPGLFAKLAISLTRWRVFFIIASVLSTLAVIYYFLRGELPDHVLAAPRSFNLLLMLATFAGLVWSGRRHRYMAGEEPEITERPTLPQIGWLVLVTVAMGLLVGGTAWLAGWTEALFPVGYTGPNGQEASGLGFSFTALTVGLLLAVLYWLYRWVAHRGLASEPQLCLAAESVALAGVLGYFITMMILSLPRPAPISSLSSDTPLGEARVELVYETPDFSEIMAPVTILPDQLLLGMTKLSGFRQSGAVLCLDRKTFQELWRFNDDGGLKPVFGQVAVVGQHVFTGEGLHTDSDRRLFRLDLLTGQPNWAKPFGTTSHTEGSPAVVEGKVYFSAGDDGLYCVDATNGQLVWQLNGQENKLHCDNPVSVVEGKVFAGSGYKTLALFALDAQTGRELWRTPVPLRSFGPPLVQGDRVYYGLGTGNLAEDLNQEPDGTPLESQPAGLVVALEAATGKTAWAYQLPKSVHTALAADSRTVYAACRDGTLHAIHRGTGQRRWMAAVGGALMTGPLLVQDHGVPLAVYAVTAEGQVSAHDPLTGLPLWSRSLTALTGKMVNVVSTPRVANDGSQEIFFGAMLTNRNTGNKSAGLFRIIDPRLR